MLRHYYYLRYVLRHKWFVFLAGYGSVPVWRLIIHDWTKFLPREWLPYARCFRNPDGSMRNVMSLRFDEQALFKVVLRRHINAHPHHWAWWVRIDAYCHIEALPMDEYSRQEMLADWRGASMAIEGKDNTAKWYQDNRDNMILHRDTRAWIEQQLGFVK